MTFASNANGIAVKKKVISDSSSKKWHILVIVYLVAIVAYIAYFAICHRILMIGFLIATLFMLFYEARIFVKEKIYRQNKEWQALLCGVLSQVLPSYPNTPFMPENITAFLRRIRNCTIQ